MVAHADLVSPYCAGADLFHYNSQKLLVSGALIIYHQHTMHIRAIEIYQNARCDDRDQGLRSQILT